MNDDDLTTRLSHELQGRSDTMHGSSLALADVQQKARSIRRRRTATAVGGAALAVALIVPTAALANHHNSHRTDPLPATQSVTPTPSSPPSPTATDGHQPAAGVLDVSDLSTGAPPRIEYVTGGDVLHRFDGSTVDLGTRFPVVGFVVLTDGTHVFETAGQGRFSVEVTGSDGTELGRRQIEGGLAVNPSHTIAAWVDPVGQVMTWTLGALKPRPLGDPVPGEGLRVGAVTGDDCSLACSVIVNGGGGDPQPWEVTPDGAQPLTDGGYVSVNDVSQAGLSIGLTKILQAGSCSTLLGGGEFQGFETCDHTLVSFSPDGRLILADPAYHDGIGNGVIAMYDVSGDLLFSLRSTARAQSFYPEAQWEDATHVLAPVYQAGKWSLVRFASDGSMEYAVPPVAGSDVDSPYVLAAGGPTVGD